jgi:predicted enzyme related to lactoylglutathione lyase
MSLMPRVVHFEIHVDNVARAVKFYKYLFGWEITHWGGPADYWLIETGNDAQPGINGGLMLRRHPREGQGLNSYVCTIDVPDVDAFVAKALAGGGLLAMAKMAVPTIGWLAYVIDTEGNILGMMQRDAAAK